MSLSERQAHVPMTNGEALAKLFADALRAAKKAHPDSEGKSIRRRGHVVTVTFALDKTNTSDHHRNRVRPGAARKDITMPNAKKTTKRATKRKTAKKVTNKTAPRNAKKTAKKATKRATKKTTPAT